jgi:hypothetical protein
MPRRNESIDGVEAKLFATLGEEEKHTIFHDEEPYLGPPVVPLPGLDENGEVEITTGQKMLSAVSGSLFTSLIGTCFSNPVDVVAIANIGF